MRRLLQTVCAASRTPPSSWYGKEWLGRELRGVWENQWICVGHTAQLHSPGQYIAGSLANTHPWVVVRGDDGELKGYFNVCRHHAAELVEAGSGTLPDATRMVCPYHGWTYETGSGRLVKARRLKGIEGFKAKDNGLVKLHVCNELGPLVWINLSETPRNLTTDLKPLAGTVDFSAMTHVKTKEYTLKCNWKVYVENYLDGGYHVPYLHEGLSSNLDESSYTTTCFDRVSLQTVETDLGANLGVDFNERLQGDRGVVYGFVYPNMMVNQYGRFIDVNYVTPGPTEGTCKVKFDYWYDGSVDDEFLSKSLDASHHVQLEDTNVCESVQRGLMSRAYQLHRGRYAPMVEHAMHHFHVIHKSQCDQEE